MLLDKLITDVFDFFADNYNEKQKKEAGGFPDTSDKPIDHLITEQEKKDPEKLYPITSEVPVINFSSPKNLPLIDIIDGTFPSPIQTPFPENNTNYVRHYRLKNRDSGPTVIMINGLNVDEYTYFDWWCWRFAAWGLDSVLIDIPYHIRRVPKGSYSGQYLITDDVMWSLLSLKQCFQDIQLLANWLKNQGVESIGTFGVSFGAFMAGLYVCQAENADFAVMGMPPVDVVDTMSKIHLGQQLVERVRPRYPECFQYEKHDTQYRQGEDFYRHGHLRPARIARSGQGNSREMGRAPVADGIPHRPHKHFRLQPSIRQRCKKVRKERDYLSRNLNPQVTLLYTVRSFIEIYQTGRLYTQAF